jgi:hypothetical protein
MDFQIWDYAPVAPSVIALIISVIAIWNPFSGENKWVKRCAIVAALLGIAATFAIRHHELDVGERERRDTEQRLSTLGQLITEGEALQRLIRAPDSPIPGTEINTWGANAENFLATQPEGASLVSRFRSFAGLPTAQLPPGLITASITGPQAQTWALLEYKLERLHQFSEEYFARMR